LRQKTVNLMNHRRVYYVTEILNLNKNKDMDTKKKNPSNKKEEAQLKLESKKQEVLPGQQIAVYSKATKKDVREVVKELNPDINSLGSRG